MPTKSEPRRWQGLLRVLLLALWLVAPVVALAWHYGPGQQQAQQSEALRLANQAQTAAQRGEWQQAATQFAQALAELPPEHYTDRDHLTLAHAAARIQAGELAEGQEQLEMLAATLQKNHQLADSELLTAVRHELATASYHAAWLMRREGATPEEWKIETERARQQFRLLAETAAANEHPDAPAFQKNLEATIKLEQMDDSTLLAMPLPKKCPNNCNNLSQRKRQQSQSRNQSQSEGQNEQEEKKPDDARNQIKQQRGAGVNQGLYKGS